jgi:hypothetical protein
MVQKVLTHSPVAGSFRSRRPVSVILVGRRARTLELQWARRVLSAEEMHAALQQAASAPNIAPKLAG